MHLPSIAAGQNTTYFLATPSDKLSDLPRHPADLEAPEVCLVCHKDSGDPLACDKVRFPSCLCLHFSALLSECLTLHLLRTAHDCTYYGSSAMHRTTLVASTLPLPRSPTGSGSAPIVHSTRAGRLATRLRRLLCHDLPRWRECARRRRVHRRMWTATRMMTRTEKTTTMKMTHRSQAGSARRPLRRQLVRTRRLLANASWMGSDVTPLDSLEAQEVVAQAFRFHSVLIYAHPHSSVLANAHAYFSCRTHTHVHSVRQRIPGRGSRR